jgi:23S rRNA pseudouridine1911/1915/1917 synthase
MILETGRTHQIRAHLKSVNTPIVGDKVYGYRTHVKHMDVKLALQQVNRQMLHAFKLRFLHPLHNEELSLEAPPPQDFADAKRLLNGEME